MEAVQRESLTRELEAMKSLQKRSMGVNQDDVMFACRELSRIRLALRNDEQMFQHFANVLAEPPRAKKSRKR